MIKELNDKLLENWERYSLFGVVLFTNSHPNVALCLENEMYYAALDEISGEHMLVLVSMLFDAHLKYPQPPPGLLPRMEPIWVEPKKNEQVLSWFEIKTRDELPVIALFGFQGAQMYYHVEHVRADSAEDVFGSLDEILSLAANVVAEHSKNGEPLQVEDLVRKLRWSFQKRRVVEGARSILRGISLLRSLTGI